MDIVADAKADATATAKRLDTLEKRRGARSPRRSRPSATRCPRSASGLVDRRDRIQTARSTKYRAAARARATAATSSRTTSRALQAQQAKIQARLAGYSGPVTRRPGQARLRRPDLAGQRPDHVAVLRVALVGVLPPGHRHRRARRARRSAPPRRARSC